MNNSLHFSDSPSSGAALYSQQNESPLQIPQALMSNDSSELSSSDKLSALPGGIFSPSPHRSPLMEGNVIPPSPTPPSLRVTRPFPASPEGPDTRPPMAEMSSGRNSSRPRVSFEGNRTPAATPNHSTRTNVHVHPLLRETVPQSPRGIDSTINHSNDPSRPPSVGRSAMKRTTNSLKKPNHESPPTTSASHSRATSPIRLFSWTAFHHSQEDTFIPVDPFRIRTRLRRLSLQGLHSSNTEHHLPFDPACEENPFFCFPPLKCNPQDRFLSFLRDARDFLLDTLPRQIYLYLLFCLPSLYFSRIARVYEDAQLSKPDLERMIESYSSSRQQEQRQRIIHSSPIPPGAHYHPTSALPFPDEWTNTNVSPALIRFKQSWEAFIDSLLREWKTLNLVSALLHTAILTMFQSQVMANDPVIRTAALLSLTSALMSLSYGCIYIVRFGTMRSMYKATRWAEEAARTTTFILWNVWVLLAMPAIWLAWSMIFFIVAILAFVWRYGTSTDPTSPQPLNPTAAIGPRVVVSALFFLGLVYLIAIVRTLHNYGRSTEHRLFTRMSMRNAIRNTAETDALGEERDSQRGRGMTRDEDHRPASPQPSGGGESARNGREQMELGGRLLAIAGLELRGLDDLVNPPSLDEMAAEKQRRRVEASV